MRCVVVRVTTFTRTHTKLGINVEDGVIVVVRADEKNPRPGLYFESDHDAQRSAEVLDADVVDGYLAAEPVGERLTAARGQVVKETVKGLGMPAREGSDLLVGAK